MNAEEEGAQMAEYSFLVSGIALVVGLAAFAFGDRVEALYITVQGLFQ